MSWDSGVLAPEERASLALRGLFEQYGYRKYRMGQFEEYSLYMDNKSFLPSENVIAFTDLDGRLMALKPDVTLSIVRHAAEWPATAEKLYYIESVYRPSAESHTFKEISQMGVEYIGRVDRYAMAEVAALAAKSLAEVGDDYLLEIGHMRFTAALLDALGLEDGPRARALDALARKNAPALRAAAAGAGLPAEDGAVLGELAGLYGPVPATLARARALCRCGEMAQALDELEEVCAAVAAVSCGARLQLDLSLVNGTGYYNGLLLRGYLKDLPRAVLAGGRYDDILKKFGKAGGGIGFALDLSEIARLPGGRAAAEIDLLIRYGPQADAALVAKAVDAAARQGLRVRALPQGEDAGLLRWTRQARLGDGGALEEMEKGGGAAWESC